MAKNKKCFTMVCYKHGIIWWLCIGWWWRPLQYTFWLTLSALFGFRKLKIEKR